MKMVAAQAKVELVLTLRRGESLLATFGIPAILLAFLAKVDVFPVEGAASRVDFLVPGVMALAVIASAMVSLGIATGFERSYLVLKRLGATPLSRRRLVAAKVGSTLAVEAAQVSALLLFAVALGWRGHGSPAVAVMAVVLGTAAFAGVGLLLAGTLPAEATWAAANGLYVVLLFLGGIAFPLSPGRVGGRGAPASGGGADRVPAGRRRRLTASRRRTSRLGGVGGGRSAGGGCPVPVGVSVRRSEPAARRARPCRSLRS